MSTLLNSDELLERALNALPTDDWYDAAADGADHFAHEPQRALHTAVNFQGLDLNEDGLPSEWQVRQALAFSALAAKQRSQEQREWLDDFVGTFGPVRKFRPPLPHAPRGAPGKPALRKELARLALHFHLIRHRIAYSQTRPIKGVNPFIKPTVIDDGFWLWDCSGFVTYLYRAATKGKIDPNNNGFSGYGYTGTLVANGSKVAVPKVGDLAFYGSPTIDHVTIFVEPGLDGRVVSMGSTPGPLLLPNDYRTVVALRRYI